MFVILNGASTTEYQIRISRLAFLPLKPNQIFYRPEDIDLWYFFVKSRFQKFPQEVNTLIGFQNVLVHFLLSLKVFLLLFTLV